ncbi:hypothetical protein BBK82_06550 [Lentzea guizhouensis]|uniref:MalT-like TPR region domain-containing protein n=1 Tax=Lentzea guizhouensis TaxID=1586287 RepID=A0A1B2HDI4_9PSEU|nr:tetratricopeptide repeat protein [Lentzea guizhouensis]ANZ35794.1 hypothetical protein BBK82_06550 [Lentzea guizhouensis]
MCLRSRIAETAADLSPHARRLLGLLAAVDAAQLPGWAPRVAFGDVRGESAVDELVSAHLVQTAGRSYAVPPLVREFAAGHVDGTDAVRRVLGGWLHLVDLAHKADYGGDFTVVRGHAHREVVRPGPELLAEPLAWLESERVNLGEAVALAAAAGLDEQAWELAHRLVTLFEHRADHEGWLRTHDLALAATEKAGNARGSAVLRCSLASLHISQSRFDLAHELTVAAKDVFEDLGDLAGLGIAYRNLGVVSRSSDDLAGARRWDRRALAAFERTGDRVGQATVLQNLAQVDLCRNDLRGAFDRLEAALRVCGDAGPARVRAQIRHRLGEVLFAQGRHDQAFDVLTEALGLVRGVRDRRGESFVLHLLGRTEFARGRLGSARTLLQESAAICDATFDVVNAARSRLELVHVLRAGGDDVLADEVEAGARAVYAEFGLETLDGDMIFRA